MTRSLLRASSLWLLTTTTTTTRATAFHPQFQSTLQLHRCTLVDTSRTFYTDLSAMPKTKKQAESQSSAASKNKNEKESKGIMMILSPAKTLDMNPLPTDEKSDSIPDSSHFTLPNCNPERTKKVVQAMKKRSQSELAKLLSISATLAKTSHEVGFVQ